MYKTKGRIVEIEKYQQRATYIKQWIPGAEQYKYDNYPGGNGTYVTGGEYLGTRLEVKIYVYDLDRCQIFDVYEDIKRIAGVSRISQTMLQTIESHKGNKVDVWVDDYSVKFDPSILLA